MIESEEQIRIQPYHWFASQKMPDRLVLPVEPIGDGMVRRRGDATILHLMPRLRQLGFRTRRALRQIGLACLDGNLLAAFEKVRSST